MAFIGSQKAKYGGTYIVRSPTGRFDQCIQYAFNFKFSKRLTKMATAEEQKERG